MTMYSAYTAICKHIVDHFFGRIQGFFAFYFWREQEVPVEGAVNLPRKYAESRPYAQDHVFPVFYEIRQIKAFVARSHIRQYFLVVENAVEGRRVVNAADFHL